MPREILEPAATPKSILGRRYRKLLHDVAHKSPALQVGQLPKVTEHAREIHPYEWIDPGNIGAAKAKVHPSGARFERGGRIVEGGSADAEHSNALSCKSAEVYVIGRMGITLRGEVGDERPRSSPAPTAFNAGCEDNLSRMDAFDPTSSTEMGEEKVAGRLNRYYLGLVFDRKLENIAAPIEVFAPYLCGKPGDPLPRSPTESRLVPGTGREARNAEVDAPHILRSP
jgi:hypothetical protein